MSQGFDALRRSAGDSSQSDSVSVSSGGDHRQVPAVRTLDAVIVDEESESFITRQADPKSASLNSKQESPEDLCRAVTSTLPDFRSRCAMLASWRILGQK